MGFRGFGFRVYRDPGQDYGLLGLGLGIWVYTITTFLYLVVRVRACILYYFVHPLYSTLKFKTEPESANPEPYTVLCILAWLEPYARRMQS